MGRPLAKEFAARLTVVHAMASAPSAGQPGSPWRQDLERSVRADLDRLRQRFGAEAEAAIEPGDPPKVVCGLAATLHADLLVIGRGSAAGVFGRLRTNAYAIIRQSPCPVVSV